MNPEIPPIAEPRGTPSVTPVRRSLLNVWQFCLGIGALLLAAGVTLGGYALLRMLSYGVSEESKFDLKSSVLVWLPGLLLMRRGLRLRTLKQLK